MSYSLVHENTASGRATRRASSDPACLLPSPTLGPRGRWLRGHGIGPRGQSIGVAAVSQGPTSAIPAPTEGNPTWTAPSGGHPNTTSSGRGWLFAFIALGSLGSAVSAVADGTSVSALGSVGAAVSRAREGTCASAIGSLGCVRVKSGGSCQLKGTDHGNCSFAM